MNDLVAKTKEICTLFEIKPQRSKGQNFLVNSRVYDDIVSAADLESGDEVLEVGPGLGFLTVRLIEQAKKVVAVELDDRLATYLQLGFAANNEDRVKIVNQDILRFNPESEFTGRYKIVANLPYNISSIFLRNFLSHPHPPEMMVLMLQKEVVERITAIPGEMSMLALSVQHYALPEMVQVVLASSFWPQPEVDSAIIKIKIKPNKFSKEQDKKFFRLAKAGFGAKRKMLKNNLVGGLRQDPEIILSALKATGIAASSRAEDLSLDNWYQLFASLEEFMV